MSRERRRLVPEDESAAEPGRFGCPMLVRTRLHLPPDAAYPVMRCSLGWALHDASEAARCAATPAVTECWKVHPERAPVVALPLPPAEADAAEVAGD